MRDKAWGYWKKKGKYGLGSNEVENAPLLGEYAIDTGATGEKHGRFR